MTRQERALLLGVAHEIVLQLRARLSEIETLHPHESALAVATFRERMRHLEELILAVQKETSGLEG